MKIQFVALRLRVSRCWKVGFWWFHTSQEDQNKEGGKYKHFFLKSLNRQRLEFLNIEVLFLHPRDFTLQNFEKNLKFSEFVHEREPRDSQCISNCSENVFKNVKFISQRFKKIFFYLFSDFIHLHKNLTDG